jgi:hypothetical protein
MLASVGTRSAAVPTAARAATACMHVRARQPAASCGSCLLACSGLMNPRLVRRERQLNSQQVLYLDKMVVVTSVGPLKCFKVDAIHTHICLHNLYEQTSRHAFMCTYIHVMPGWSRLQGVHGRAVSLQVDDTAPRARHRGTQRHGGAAANGATGDGQVRERWATLWRLGFVRARDSRGRTGWAAVVRGTGGTAAQV